MERDAIRDELSRGVNFQERLKGLSSRVYLVSAAGRDRPAAFFVWPSRARPRRVTEVASFGRVSIWELCVLEHDQEVGCVEQPRHIRLCTIEPGTSDAQPAFLHQVLADQGIGMLMALEGDPGPSFRCSDEGRRSRLS
jgi:hypothetical protein